MQDPTIKIYNELIKLGANLVSFGDLRELPADVRESFPIGITVAVKYPKEVIAGIAELPTQEYCDWYNKLNEKLDSIVTQGAEYLKSIGFNAVGQSRAKVGNGENELNTKLPHKTVATRAGVGWIGKCALLVTEQYGSMIRISTILTDAPLRTATPINESKCGGCTACADACPADSISGKSWEIGLYRDEFFDAVKCRAKARERVAQSFGGDVTICGKCIEICPYTRRATGE